MFSRGYGWDWILLGRCLGVGDAVPKQADFEIHAILATAATLRREAHVHLQTAEQRVMLTSKGMQVD